MSICDLNLEPRTEEHTAWLVEDLGQYTPSALLVVGGIATSTLLTTSLSNSPFSFSHSCEELSAAL